MKCENGVTKKSTNNEVNFKAFNEYSKVENISPETIISDESYSNSPMSQGLLHSPNSSSLQYNCGVEFSTEEYPGYPSVNGITSYARRMRKSYFSYNPKSENMISKMDDCVKESSYDYKLYDAKNPFHKVSFIYSFYLSIHYPPICYQKL